MAASARAPQMTNVWAPAAHAATRPHAATRTQPPAQRTAPLTAREVVPLMANSPSYTLHCPNPLQDPWLSRALPASRRNGADQPTGPPAPAAAAAPAVQAAHLLHLPPDLLLVPAACLSGA